MHQPLSRELKVTHWKNQISETGVALTLIRFS